MAASKAVFAWKLNQDNLDSRIATGIPMGGETDPNTLGASHILSSRLFAFPSPLKGSRLVLAMDSAGSTVSAELWTRDTDGLLWMPVCTFTGADYNTTIPGNNVWLETLTGTCILRFTSLSVAGGSQEARLFQLLLEESMTVYGQSNWGSNYKRAFNGTPDTAPNSAAPAAADVYVLGNVGVDYDVNVGVYAHCTVAMDVVLWLYDASSATWFSHTSVTVAANTRKLLTSGLVNGMKVYPQVTSAVAGTIYMSCAAT